MSRCVSGTERPALGQHDTVGVQTPLLPISVPVAQPCQCAMIADAGSLSQTLEQYVCSTNLQVVLQTTMIKPEVLRAAGITVHKVVQHPGDFIINFPGHLSSFVVVQLWQLYVIVCVCDIHSDSVTLCSPGCRLSLLCLLYLDVPISN